MVCRAGQQGGLFTKPSPPSKTVTNQVFTCSTQFVFTRTGWSAKIGFVLRGEMFSCLAGAAVGADVAMAGVGSVGTALGGRDGAATWRRTGTGGGGEHRQELPALPSAARGES